jgi:hypothetical protein
MGDVKVLDHSLKTRRLAQGFPAVGLIGRAAKELAIDKTLLVAPSGRLVLAVWCHQSKRLRVRNLWNSLTLTEGLARNFGG